jgi:hypothetical protein
MDILEADRQLLNGLQHRDGLAHTVPVVIAECNI